MKRMLAAAILSMLVHAFFLGTNLGRFEKKPCSKPAARIVSLSLEYRPAPKPYPAPSVKKPAPVPAVTPPPGQKIRHMPRRPKPVPSPKPPVPVPTTEKKEPSPIIPPIETAQIPEPRPVPAPVNRKTKPDRDKSGPRNDRPLVPDQTVAEQNKTDNVLSRPAEPTLIKPAIKEARPLYRSNPPPRYPRMARRRGLHGTVILEVFIDKKGGVGDIKVFKTSGHSLLDRAALAAVKNWSFEPGMRGDEKIEMWVKIPICFELN